MKLSEHFELSELTRTSTGLPNNPTQGEVLKLTDLCVSILEVIRAKWGPVKIDSGFRCLAVNEAVGGVADSQHVFGEAADIVPVDVTIVGVDEVYEWIVKKSGLRFGQCINERRGSSHWIHVSLPRMNGKKNQEALVFDGHTYKPYAG